MEFPGQLYKQFALTIAASTVLSGFNSLTLTPALCALFLEKSKPSNFFIYKGFNKAYDKTQGVYDKIVKWLLQRPGMALASYGALTVIGLLLLCIGSQLLSRTRMTDILLLLFNFRLPPALSVRKQWEKR